jgi:hypothetical protein
VLSRRGYPNRLGMLHQWQESRSRLGRRWVERLLGSLWESGNEVTGGCEGQTFGLVSKLDGFEIAHFGNSYFGCRDSICEVIVATIEA